MTKRGKRKTKLKKEIREAMQKAKELERKKAPTRKEISEEYGKTFVAAEKLRKLLRPAWFLGKEEHVKRKRKAKTAKKRKRKDPAGCDCGASSRGVRGVSFCKVDALITIDGRGQIVLPKDIRERSGIEAGDKLAVISWESDGQVCCLSLIKADEFGASLKGLLGPMMEQILQS